MKSFLSILSCLTVVCLSPLVSADPVSQDDVWIDRWQQNLSQSFSTNAQNIDSWFADADKINPDAGASGRVMLGWEPRSTQLDRFDQRVRLKYRLPSLKNRVDLLLSDEDEFDDDALQASREVSQPETNTTLALRFFSPRFDKINYRVGLGRGAQLFGRTTFRDIHHISAKANLLYDTQVYYYSEDKWGAEVGGSLLYEHTGQKLDRLSHRWYWNDKRERFKWTAEAQRYFRLSAQSSFVLTAYIQGFSEPNMHTEQVYFSAKVRANPLRKWLFFEIEPFVIFLKKEDFRRSYGMALRFEAYFGQNANSQY